MALSSTKPTIASRARKARPQPAAAAESAVAQPEPPARPTQNKRPRPASKPPVKNEKLAAAKRGNTHGFQKGAPRALGAGPNDKTVYITEKTKVVNDARRAIAMFVDGNANRLQDWLDSVANGVAVVTKEGDTKYVVPPDPVRAFAMFQSVIEYHIPKLARQEVTGPDGGAIQLQNMNLRGLSQDELTLMEQLLAKAALPAPVEQS